MAITYPSSFPRVTKSIAHSAPERVLATKMVAGNYKTRLQSPASITYDFVGALSPNREITLEFTFPVDQREAFINWWTTDPLSRRFIKFNFQGNYQPHKVTLVSTNFPVTTTGKSCTAAVRVRAI